MSPIPPFTPPISEAVFRTTHTFAVAGSVDDGTLPAFFANLAASQGATIAGAHVRTSAGTATIAVQHNGVAVPGIDALAADSTSGFTAATTPPAIADDDKIDVVISAAAAATDLSVTVVLEHEVS